MFNEMKNLVLNKFQEVSQTITEQKEELEEKVTKSSIKFAQKPLEKQFDVKRSILSLNLRVQKALKKDYKKAKKLVREEEELLLEHEEDLLIADSSQHGWLTVSKIRDKKFLNSSLVKKIAQVDSLIEKSWNGLDAQNSGRRQQYGSSQQYGGWQQYGAQGSVVMKRPEKKSSPEELLLSVAKTTRAGQCSFCLEPGHWYRKCPPPGFLEQSQGIEPSKIPE